LDDDNEQEIYND
jgi:hypothetical protein